MNVRLELFGGTLLLFFAAFSLSTGAASAQSAAQAATNQTSQTEKTVSAPVRTSAALEPKDIELLKASCARLAAAHSMSFTVEVTYESPSRMGFPLAYTTKSEVVMQRPDKLRVITLGDGPASEFYYDGKMMMAYALAEDLVAIADQC
jgi:hypothetical protein